MRRLAPRPLGPAVEALRDSLAPATTLARVQGVWGEVVGEALAEECRPLSERAGVVTVGCRSSVWAQELSMMAAELVERLNAALGTTAIAELRFAVRG